jgi:hypothetical protein
MSYAKSCLFLSQLCDVTHTWHASQSRSTILAELKNGAALCCTPNRFTSVRGVTQRWANPSRQCHPPPPPLQWLCSHNSIASGIYARLLEWMVLQPCTAGVAATLYRLIFGRCWVRISAETPTVLAKVLHGFPQSLQANPGWLDHASFLSNPSNLSFIRHPTIRRCDI